MGEVILYVDELYEDVYSTSIPFCRICHEAEFESCKSLEAPCSCSGTAKFAHKDCIQRWCDEKGNTICEICLQKFEPAYTALPKKAQIIGVAAVTIRGSLEVPRREGTDEENEDEADAEEEGMPETDGFSSTAYASSRWRSVATIFTVLLLVRHFHEVLTHGTGDYPFPILTLLIVKASGILIPVYIIMRIVTAIHNSIILYHHDDFRSQSTYSTSQRGRRTEI